MPHEPRNRPPGDPPPPDGRNRGLFGCLGCAGAAVLVLIAVPVLLIVGTWAMLPRLVAPADTGWVMVEAHPERGVEIRERIDAELARLDQGESTTLDLSEADLNQLLANALAERSAGTEPGSLVPQARFRIEEESLYFDAMVHIPEDHEGVPGRLRGRPAGMRLGLTPRAAGEVIAMRVHDVRLGRIPLPVETAMQLAAQAEDADHDLPFLEPDTGELRISLQQLGAGAAGLQATGITVGDGRLRVMLTR